MPRQACRKRNGLGDRTAANRNVVSVLYDKPHFSARENMVGYSRIGAYDASAQRHFGPARWTPHTTGKLSKKQPIELVRLAAMMRRRTLRLSRSRFWLNVQKDRRFRLRLELDSGGSTAAGASAHRAGGKHLRPIERRVSFCGQRTKGRSHIARWRI